MEKEILNLQNQLLIAMPGIGDPRFAHSVTLIARHDNSGCFGITINYPTETNFGDLLSHLEIKEGRTALLEKPILMGGPVKPEQGFVLHDTDKSWENTIRITDNLAITASKDILTDIATDNGPKNFLVALGCASWSAGQVEEELLDNAWLTCPADHQILFHTPYPQRWQSASQLLGIDVRLMSDVSGHA